jgi:putative MATE family efflux protein
VALRGGRRDPPLSAATAPPRAAPIGERTRWLLEAPVFATLLRLCAPNLLNLVAITALVTLDGVFIGRLGADALAGVSLVFPFVMAVHHLANAGLGGAVSSAIARALGAGEREKAAALATHALVIAAALAALFTAVMLTAGPSLYRWMGGQGAMLEIAVSYSSVVFSGAAAICLLNTLASVARGSGNMLLPSAAQFGAIAGYAISSPLLIFGAGPVPALGAPGAAWALIASFGSAAVVVFWRLRSGQSVRPMFRGLRFQGRLFRDILRVGIPGLVNVGISSVTVVILTAVAGRLGREAQVGYALAARLEYVIVPVTFVVGLALVAMVGTNWGAGQYRRAMQIAWTGAALAASACGALGLVFAFFPGLWMGLFTLDAEVTRHGSLYLQIVAPVYAAYGFGHALYFSLQGMGTIKLAVLANAARLAVSAGGGLVAGVWLGGGPAGVFIAIAAAFVLFALLNACILLHARRPH